MNRRNFFKSLVGAIAAAAILGDTPMSQLLLPIKRKLRCRWTYEAEQCMTHLHLVSFDPAIARPA